MRYKVVEESESGHCCFEATVVDTVKEKAGKNCWICECFNIDSANLICKLLNERQQDV